MTGAMYAAIAGLRTHMQNLNVIGNNVANVNTNGYKAGRAVFKTSLYTTLTGGSDGTPVMGGVNPSQIGYGANVSTVDVDMSTGNYAVTGKPTDMMLDGDGFFMVGDKEIANNFDGSANDVDRLTSLLLTRVGNFEFKADGYFANNDGNVVYGFLCVGKYGDGDPKHDLYQIDQIANDGTITYKKDANGNPLRREDIPADAKLGDPIFSDQFVPIHYPQVMSTVKYYKEDPTTKILTEVNTPADIFENGKDGKLKDGIISKKSAEILYPQDKGAGGLVPHTKADGTEYPTAQFKNITIDKNTGMIAAVSNDTGEVVTIGCIGVGIVTNPNGVTNMGDNYYKASDGSGDLTVAILGGNAEAMGIDQINASKFSGVDANGVAVAAPEIDGLRPRTSDTKALSGGLEMSKTDLAQEIANMILTQRGYQANTRIITVTDSMLEELVNMKR